MDATIRVGDFVALIPHRFGFEPRGSLVIALLTTCAPGRGRLGLMIRLDHAKGRRMEDRDAAEIASLTASEPGADTAILVFFLDGPGDEGAVRDLDESATRIAVALAAERGVRVLDTLWSDMTHWGRVGEGECRPRTESAATMPLIVAGSAPLPSLGELCRLPVPKESPARLARAWSRAPDPGEAMLRLGADLEILRGLVRHPDLAPGALDQELGERRLPTADTAALLSRTIERLPLRDRVLATLGHPEELGKGGREAGGAMEGWPGLVGAENPSWLPLAVAYARRWAALARQAGQEPAAELTILAWLEWSRMRSSWAGEYVRQALAADPHYSLAILLERALRTGMMPAWVARD